LNVYAETFMWAHHCLELGLALIETSTVFNRSTTMRRYLPQLAATGQHKPPVDELTMSLGDNLAS